MRQRLFGTTLLAGLLMSGPSVLAGNGACCLPGGTCTETSFEECVASGGDFLGNIPCNEETCPSTDPDGACCLSNGQCLNNVQASQCPGQHFPNQACVQIECIATGACCFEEGGECFELDRDGCSANGGVYQGDGSTCNQVNCFDPTGACCVDNGDGSFTCFDNVPLSQCAGTFTGGASCIDLECPPPPPTGACCISGSCVISSAADCGNNGGTYLGNGTACGPGVCPDPIGACCVDEGNGFFCFEGPQSQCGGNFFQGRRCSEIVCPPAGACCLPDGSCNVVPEDACLNAGGTFIAGGSCNECPPPPPVGACCEDTVCTIRTENICRALGGEYLGDGTDCADANCAVCPCNLNNDDRVDVLDLLDFLTLWFPTNGSAVPPGTGADFNGDGMVNVLDLLDFLACWFPASNGENCP